MARKRSPLVKAVDKINILTDLFRSEGRLPVSKEGLSDLRELRRKGYVKLVISEQDSKTKIASLTKKGVSTIKELGGL